MGWGWVGWGEVAWGGVGQGEVKQSMAQCSAFKSNAGGAEVRARWFPWEGLRVRPTHRWVPEAGSKGASNGGVQR